MQLFVYWLLISYLLATLRHMVGRLSGDNTCLRRYLYLDYFRQKEGKPAKKIQLERFNFSSLLFYKEEKKLFS